MYLHALAPRLAPHRFTQRECWERLAAARGRLELGPRAWAILRRVLLGDTGLETRHFVLPEPAALLDLDAEGLARAFEREAPPLAAGALADALAQAGWEPSSLDAVVLCTCTGYLCPGVSSHVAERLGLRPDVVLNDLVGLGCGAALPTWRDAAGLLALHPGARVATVAVEACSLAFFLDDDPGVLVSACLFGDGAAAALWTTEPPAGRPAWRADGFRSVHRPAQRQDIRFENRQGKLRNLLSRAVPGHVADAVGDLWRSEPEPVRAAVVDILSHGGGRDVLDALEPVLGRPLPEARAVLRRAGNLSSPSVLLALADRLAAPPPPPGSTFWLTGFGAGFAAHCARLHRTA